MSASPPKAFDRLMIVAPPFALGDLRAALSEQMKPHIYAELGKDLTKTPAAELPGASGGRAGGLSGAARAGMPMSEPTENSPCACSLPRPDGAQPQRLCACGRARPGARRHPDARPRHERRHAGRARRRARGLCARGAARSRRQGARRGRRRRRAGAGARARLRGDHRGGAQGEGRPRRHRHPPSVEPGAGHARHDRRPRAAPWRPAAAAGQVEGARALTTPCWSRSISRRPRGARSSWRCAGLPRRASPPSPPTAPRGARSSAMTRRRARRRPRRGAWRSKAFCRRCGTRSARATRRRSSASCRWWSAAGPRTSSCARRRRRSRS